MAEQSVRHMSMVVALVQCASETRTAGADAREAATRCIESFRKMFPNATRDELCSALQDAETRTSEPTHQPATTQTIASIIDLPRDAAETGISDRAFRAVNSKLMAARRSGVARFILRHAQPAWPAAGILALLPVWMTRG